MKITELAAEISKRDKGDVATVKRILRHVADLMAEEWSARFELNVSECLRRNGMGRVRKKKQAP